MFRIAPYNQVSTVRRNNEFDNLFQLMDGFFSEEPRTEFFRGFKVDILDNKDNYLFEAELPGVLKEDITVDYKDNQLVIKVEKNTEEENKEVNYIRRERTSQSMQRVFNVKDIQKDAISAKYENGVLSIVAPKLVEDETSTSIEIQ